MMLNSSFPAVENLSLHMVIYEPDMTKKLNVSDNLSKRNQCQGFVRKGGAGGQRNKTHQKIVTAG
jgi:hypothetical protein